MKKSPEAMKAICVYCGSSSGSRPLYEEGASKLGKLLALRHLTLVYGGSRYGLMGQVANGVLEGGGKAIGVLPEALKIREVAHPGLTEIYVVKDMHERKAKMAALADAFIALPGGFGTLEEVLEMITWNQLKFQSKPIGFFNLNGFYDPLFGFIENLSREGFADPQMLKALRLESDPEKLLDRILNEPWPKLGPWPIVS